MEPEPGSEQRQVSEEPRGVTQSLTSNHPLVPVRATVVSCLSTQLEPEQFVRT
jgi:hypothetical protein